MRVLKKYPFSLQHTFFDPSMIVNRKSRVVNKINKRYNTHSRFTIYDFRFLTMFALRGLLQSSRQAVQRSYYDALLTTIMRIGILNQSHIKW